MWDWLAWGLGLWLLTGFLPALGEMLYQARQTYYIDPLAPLWGALRGPFTLWAILARRRRSREVTSPR